MQDINMHLKSIFEEGELDEKATCKNFSTRFARNCLTTRNIQAFGDSFGE